MENGFLDNFNLPEGAAEAIKRSGVRDVSIGDGINRFISGHDKGVAYRFFVHAEYNPTKSKIAKYEVFDEIEMIEWLTDKFTQPTERVRFLPPELLTISEDGDVYGRYADAYKRFKLGLEAPGLPLNKWGVLSDGEIATLAAMGIFSVEQFAAQPRGKVDGRLPRVFVDAFERAIQYVNGKEGRVAIEKQTEEIVNVTKENERLKRQMEGLKVQMDAVLNLQTKPKKLGWPKGKPRKVKVVEEAKETENVQY